MKKRTTVLLILAILAMLAGALHGQELVYEQREQQVSYDGAPGTPAIAFNGVDYAAFYIWSGNEDKNIGLHMRRIDRDGVPFGPQRQVLPLDIRDPFVFTVWDGSAYTVFISQFRNITWHIVRVDVKGNMLGHRKVFVTPNKYNHRRAFPFVLDDRVFFFFSTIDSPFIGVGGGMSYMITADRELKEKPVLTKLPTGGLQKTTTLGVALDPDKFLVFLGQYSDGADQDLDEAALLHIDFEGKLKKTVQPAIFAQRGAEPAEQLQTFDLFDAVGPVFTGDGYIIIGAASNLAAPNSSYPYINSSAKIDDTGQIIDGPYNLGNGDFFLFLGKPLLLGRYIGMPFNDLIAADTQIMLIGPRGRHITDITVHEHRFGVIFPVGTDAVYSGSGCALLTLGLKDRNSLSLNFALYSNIITDPPFVKPAIVYFQASSASPFGDTRRLVMWSVSSSTNVTLTGPDLELTNLPPVFHHVVDTNGERTRLTLSITGTDGKTKTKRLVIEP